MGNVLEKPIQVLEPIVIDRRKFVAEVRGLRSSPSVVVRRISSWQRHWKRSTNRISLRPFV